MTTGTDVSSTVKGDNKISAENIVADSSSANEMDTSMQDMAKPNKLPHMPVSSDADMEQTDAYSDNTTPANTTTNSQIPTDNDVTIKASNDTTEDPLSSLEDPKMKETQTQVTKQSIVLKLQTLSDLGINIWSNKVAQYHIFKVNTSAETPKNALMGYSLWEHSKPKKNPEHSVSLRVYKEVDYSLMLTSDLDSEPEYGHKKPKNY